MKEAASDTKRLRELANMATSGPWVWDVATYWDDSAHADAWSTDMEGHPLYESLEGPAHEVLGATYSGNIEAYPDDAAYIAALNPAVVLSLLDRIEELERRDVFDAERAQTWNAAVALRGAVRVALDEWHKFTDHLDDSIAVHDILLNAYQDTAGKIP